MLYKPGTKISGLFVIKDYKVILNKNLKKHPKNDSIKNFT